MKPTQPRRSLQHLRVDGGAPGHDADSERTRARTPRSAAAQRRIATESTPPRSRSLERRLETLQRRHLEARKQLRTTREQLRRLTAQQTPLEEDGRRRAQRSAGAPRNGDGTSPAVECHSTEAQLAYRVEFEHLLAKIAARFINLPAAEMASETSDALKCIGEFAGVDRVYLLSVADDGSTKAAYH